MTHTNAPTLSREAIPCLLLASTILAFACLAATSLPAQAQQTASPDYVTSPIALICPTMVDLKWQPRAIPPGCTWLGYELSREPPPPGQQNPIWKEGSDPTIDFYRDELVESGQTYKYQLRDELICPSTAGPSPVQRTYGPEQAWHEAVVGDYCWGTLYEDWDFSGGEHYIQELRIKEDAILRVMAYAVVRPYNFAHPAIICGDEESSAPPTLIVDHAELISVTLEYGTGSAGYVWNSTFHGGGVSLDGEASDLPISGNTFAGGFDPHLDHNRIKLWHNSSAIIEDNMGTFGIYLQDQARAAIRNNDFLGLVDLKRGAEATLENNTLRGSLTVSGYGALPGAEARATVSGGSITSLSASAVLLSAANHAHVTVTGARLQNTLCSVPTTCTAVTASSGADLSIWRSRLRGGVLAGEDVVLNLFSNPQVQGKIQLGNQSVGHVRSNHIEGYVRAGGQAYASLVDNVFARGTVFIDDEVRGEIRQNAFWQSWTYAFDLEGGGSHPDLIIEHNCIESGTGLIVRRTRTAPVVVQNNWWGHATGPYHITLNPDGQGALISYEDSSSPAQVDFRPYLEEARFCHTKPPPASVVATATISPQGGSLQSPDGVAQLTFPAGAVSQNVEVAYSTGSLAAVAHRPARGAVKGAPSPASGPLPVGLAAVRFFNLSAVLSGTTTPVTQFLKPYTVTIHYTEDERGGAAEQTLALYWRDGTTWVREPSSQVHAGEGRVTAAPQHMTAFALLGEINQAHLPLIMR
jgi:hypothetical protein